LANTGFQTVYNYIGLEPRREAMHWQFGEMKFGELEQFWHAFTSRGFDSVSWAFLYFSVMLDVIT